MLTVLDHVPGGFLGASARDLHCILPGPTLIELPGRRAEPLFVSILLHGNEDAGLTAMQSVLAQHSCSLPRALALFVGNVSAAAAGVRRLSHQPDYNRIWPGTDSHGSEEHGMLTQIVQRLRDRHVFASIDVHNNTGTNPHYACVNRLDDRFLHFATLFSRTVVYFRRPLGVQSAAFAGLCPAITVECGKPGNAAGAAHAAEMIEAALNLSEFPQHRIRRQDVDLYHTVGVVKVARDASFSFDVRQTDVRFAPRLERLNFCDLAPGTVLAELAPGCQRGIEVWGEQDEDLTDHFLARHGELVLIRREVTPAMLTADERAVRQDCLCYFMERLELPAA
jgi:succinylglutamate desuccinylase